MSRLRDEVQMSMDYEALYAGESPECQPKVSGSVITKYQNPELKSVEMT